LRFHTVTHFFWTQTCIASLLRNPPRAEGFEVEIVVVDNSPWSPAIRGIIETQFQYGFENHVQDVELGIIPNHKSNKFHASALDCVVEKFDFDYLMSWETDVLALRPGWLQWFVDQMRPTDYAVGHWHHEQFINPSCTLYRGDVVREMAKWCKANPEPTLLRWGPDFTLVQDLAEKKPERDYQDWFDSNVEWIIGPFADKRGWPAGTRLKEKPSGQEKGVSWYEPGQMLHHWAVEAGYTYTVCPTITETHENGMPICTHYGDEDPLGEGLFQIRGQTAHMWGGTRALDILKHEVTCNFVKANTPFWLEREARMWKASVPQDVQEETLALIRQHGWHYKGAGTPDVTERDREAVRMVQECYARGGVVI
jgi:hypothetical protein